MTNSFHHTFYEDTHSTQKIIGLDVKICKTKTKKTSKNKKPAKLQQPTAEAIKEQVSSEVDKQLPKKVLESALKKSFKKQKKRGLAYAIFDSQKKINTQNEADQVTSLETAFSDSGINEMGEIVENSSSVLPALPVSGVRIMLLQGAEEEAIVEEGDLTLGRTVRVIHMIILLHHLIFMRTKGYR